MPTQTTPRLLDALDEARRNPNSPAYGLTRRQAERIRDFLATLHDDCASGRCQDQFGRAAVDVPNFELRR